MAFDSNGNWSSDFYPITDRDNSVPILASKFQTLIQSNLKQSFENCILRDGTGKPTANINFNSHKITNLADGTNNNDAINKSQLDSAIAVSAGEEQQGTIEISTEAEALAGTDDTTAMTPAKVKAVIDTLVTTTRFCANSGHANTDGTPYILSRTQTSTATFTYVSESYPLVCTTAAGTSFTITSIDSVDISGYADGTYNIFVDSNSVAYIYPNVIYRQANQPSSMNTNDIWLDTREPFKSYIKTGTGLVETDLVPLPERIVIESGAITSVEVLGYYNDNRVNNDVCSLFEKLTHALAPVYSTSKTVTSGVTYTADAPGWLHLIGVNQSYSESNRATVTINGVERPCGNTFSQIFIPKGYTYKVDYSSTPNFTANFRYCNGITGVTF